MREIATLTLIVLCECVYVGHQHSSCVRIQQLCWFFVCVMSIIKTSLWDFLLLLRKLLKASTPSLFLVPCTGKPKSVANSRLSCTQSACQISCLEEHKFPNGETTMQYICNNGQWMLKSFEFNEVPPCDRKFSPKMHFSISCLINFAFTL